MMRSGARSASGGGGDEAPRAPPYCIECRFMLQCAFLFRGNSSDTSLYRPLRVRQSISKPIMCPHHERRREHSAPFFPHGASPYLACRVPVTSP